MKIKKRLTKFEDLPDDFHCELCGVGKEEFSAE